LSPSGGLIRPTQPIRRRTARATALRVAAAGCRRHPRRR
jgi:hypothetical protein